MRRLQFAPGRSGHWLRAVSAGLVLLCAVGVPGTLTARADPAGIVLDVKMRLKADGSMSVDSTITVPPGADAADQLPLDIPVEGNRIQHFQVSDIAIDGGAKADVDGRHLIISAPARGTSRVSYTVAGTVADGPDLQQVTWIVSAGWSIPVQKLTGSFASPSSSPDSPICGFGQLGERRLCTLTETDSQGFVKFQQNGLPEHSVAAFSILLPHGTSTATATFSPIVAGSTSAPSRDIGGAIAVGAAVLIASLLAGWAWLRRRAHEALATTAGATSSLLVRQAGQTTFGSPDGVLPGQIGILTTGRVRPADISATMLDLAARNYVWIAELPDTPAGPDFQISRRAEPDKTLTAFEHAVLAAVFEGDRQTVSAAELIAGPRPVNLQASRAAIAASAVGGGWLRRDVTRRYGRLEAAGFATSFAAIVAAAVLTLIGFAALWAVAVAVLGAGAAAAGRLLPSHTTSGSRLTAAIGGMRQYLAQLDLNDIEESARPLLFSRAIAYTESLGELRNWLGKWGPPHIATLGWYRPLADRPNSVGLTVLAALLDGLATQSEAAEQRSAAPHRFLSG